MNMKYTDQFSPSTDVCNSGTLRGWAWVDTGARTPENKTETEAREETRLLFTPKYAQKPTITATPGRQAWDTNSTTPTLRYRGLL